MSTPNEPPRYTPSSPPVSAPPVSQSLTAEYVHEMKKLRKQLKRSNDIRERYIVYRIHKDLLQRGQFDQPSILFDSPKRRKIVPDFYFDE